MNYDELVRTITPEIYANMRRALETGRWPDGRQLTEKQREDTMSAVIAYDQLNLPENQRTGYIDRGQKEGEMCDDDTQPLTFKE